MFWIAFFLTALSMTAGDAKRELVTLKAEIMSADYRGDVAKLATLRTRAAKLSDHAEYGYLADYWTGFASWRMAINGTNVKMPLEEMKVHLDQATADFERSIAKKSDFADSYAAVAGTFGWLAAFHRNDTAEMERMIKRSYESWSKALELDPGNPRALWIKAAAYLYAPPERGGNRDKAVEVYHEMVKVAGPPKPDSPFPDWGKPEALMSLAWAHLNQPKPDLDAAADEARAAIRLQPEWYYVKDVLMPQIEAKRKETASKTSAQ